MEGTKWFAVTVYLTPIGNVWEDIVRYAVRVSVKKPVKFINNALVREAISKYPNAMRVEVEPMYNEVTLSDFLKEV